MNHNNTLSAATVIPAHPGNLVDPSEGALLTLGAPGATRCGFGRTGPSSRPTPDDAAHQNTVTAISVFSDCHPIAGPGSALRARGQQLQSAVKSCLRPAAARINGAYRFLATSRSSNRSYGDPSSATTTVHFATVGPEVPRGGVALTQA